MGGESLEVAGERPRQPEEPDGDDGHGQREDRRVLGRARDEVAGGRHEPDAAEHGERAERDRQDDARLADAGET